MATFAISLILVFAYYALTMFDFGKAINAVTFASVFFMFPMVTAWSIGGWFFRDRMLKKRLYLNIGISALLAVCFALFFAWITAEAEVGVDTSGAASLIGSAVLVGIAGIVAGFITFYWVIDENKPTLKKTAYTTIQTGPSTSKSSAKPKSKGKK
jgi:hypothetical protein